MSMKNDILKYKIKIEDEERINSKAFVMALFSEIVQRTPVDTGRARGSWEMNHVMPTSERHKINKAGIAIEPSRLSTWLQKPDQAIFIASLLPYISALEHGHSEQASPGFMLRGSINYIKNQFGL